VLSASAALAQDAVVKRNVYLRPEPSTSNEPIRKLIPPDEVELIETSPVDGYYHIRTIEGSVAYMKFGGSEPLLAVIIRRE
jgi:hypothetical protein